MLFEFPKFNIKILVLLIYPIFNRLEALIVALYLKEDNSLFDAFRYFISYIIAGILLFISYKINKGNKSKLIHSEEIEDLNEKRKISTYSGNIINSISQLKHKNIKKRKIKDMIILSVLCAICLFVYLYRNNLLIKYENIFYERTSILILFDLAFYIVLSHFILKHELYKHHWVSIIIISVILIILSIITFIYIGISKRIVISTLYYLIYSVAFAIYDILCKKYWNDSYNSPYFLMFSIGMICAILLIIYDIFAYLLNPDISGVIIGFQKNIKNAANFFEFFLV